jgi:hypothetical protein
MMTSTDVVAMHGAIMPHSQGERRSARAWTIERMRRLFVQSRARSDATCSASLVAGRRHQPSRFSTPSERKPPGLGTVVSPRPLHTVTATSSANAARGIAKPCNTLDDRHESQAYQILYSAPFRCRRRRRVTNASPRAAGPCRRGSSRCECHGACSSLPSCLLGHLLGTVVYYQRDLPTKVPCTVIVQRRAPVVHPRRNAQPISVF